MDPAAAGKPRLPIIRRSSDIKVPSREKRYVFDKAYDGNTDNRTLYNGTVKVQLHQADGAGSSDNAIALGMLLHYVLFVCRYERAALMALYMCRYAAAVARVCYRVSPLPASVCTWRI